MRYGIKQLNYSQAGGWGVRIWALLILALLATPAWAAEQTPAPWVTDLDKGLQTARQTHKPVLIMFSASWCPPCQMMHRDVLPNGDVQKKLADWVPVLVDEAQAGMLLRQYKVEAFPTFVILNAKGEEEDRFMGLRTSEEFIKRLGTYQETSHQLSRIESDLSRSPNDARLWKERGDVLTKIGQIDKGLEAYHKAQDLDPRNATGVAADIYFFESLQTAEKDPQAGQDKLGRLEQLYPNSSRVDDALFMRAMIALHDQQRGEAQRLLQDYQKRFPQGKFSASAGQVLDQLKSAPEQVPAPSQPGLRGVPGVPGVPGAPKAPGYPEGLIPPGAGDMDNKIPV